MKQLARLKFSQNNLKVPTNWQNPANSEHYGKAFKDSEKTTSPDTTAPPLFMPATMNKYHTETQKKLNSDFGTFIDTTCDAICGAWSQWQSAATMVGVMIMGPMATLGQVVGIPWQPLILAQGAKSTPMQMKYTNVIATVLSTSWMTYTATIKVAMSWYPLFAAMASPVAPPTPNIPCPVSALIQVPVSIQPMLMKMQMVGQLADPMAPFHQELFDCICDAFDKCFKIWQNSTMVTNVMGTGPVPTFLPPYVPVGPVVGGVGIMTPGGFV